MTVRMSMKALYASLALLVRIATGCQLVEPLDLGRPLSSQTLRNGPFYFTQGELQNLEYHGARISHNTFCSGEHVGTHFDAPYHFYESGWTVEQVPLERLIANGVFLNVSAEVFGNNSFRLQPSHIDNWIQRNGPFPNNSLLLISYGWAQLYHNYDLYAGTNSSDFDQFRFPGLSSEALNRLAQIDEIVGLGVDTPSIDSPGFGEAHAVLAAKNIYNLEQMNLDQPCLPEKGFKVFAMPMNIAGGTGAPTRIIAIPECPS